jgi:hypothetical protein
MFAMRPRLKNLFRTYLRAVILFNAHVPLAQPYVHKPYRMDNSISTQLLEEEA